MEASITQHRLPPFVTHQIYTVRFFNKFIKTAVTLNPSIVDQWIRNTESFLQNRDRNRRHRRHRTVVGLDIQYRRTFACRRTPATINLCVGDRCIVYQFLYSLGIPKSLHTFFNSPNYTFVGIGIRADLDQIQMDLNYGIDPSSVVDLRELAARQIGDGEIRSAGMEELAMRVLKLVVVRPREIACSRWDNMVLTSHQVQFACIEAFISLKIGCVLNA